MRAKDYVGKTIRVNACRMPLDVEDNASVWYVDVKVVGYHYEALIVDGMGFGWVGFGWRDTIVKPCATYWYINIEDIERVLE